MDTRNRYKVPLKAWRRWNRAERHVFNETFRNVRDEHSILATLPVHEALSEVPDASLRVFAFNIAWLAADAAREARL